MTEGKLVPLTLSLPQNLKDRLRVLAAEKNLNNPTEYNSISSIAREAFSKYFEKMESEK